MFENELIQDLFSLTQTISCAPEVYSQFYKSVSFFPRHNMEDSLFFVIHYRDWDGKLYLEEAKKRGIAGVVISEADFEQLRSHTVFDNLNLHVVKSVEETAEQLAKSFREAFAGTVIGVTGSSGKTQSVLLLNELLQSKYTVQFNDQSRNNFWGIFLLLCSLKKDTNLIVAELGARRPGEIKKMAEILLPQKVLITALHHTHLKYLENLESVKKLKSEIFSVSGINEVFVPEPLAEELALDRTCYKVTTFNEPESAAHPLLHGKHMPTLLASLRKIAFSCGLSEGEMHDLLSKDLPVTDYGMQWLTDKKGRRFFIDGRTNSPESIYNFLDTMAGFNLHLDLLILAATKDLGDHKKKFTTQIAGRAATLTVKRIVYLDDDFEEFRQAYQSHSGIAEIFRGAYEHEEIEKHLEFLKTEDVYAIQGHMEIWFYKLIHSISDY